MLRYSVLSKMAMSLSLCNGGIVGGMGMDTKLDPLNSKKKDESQKIR